MLGGGVLARLGCAYNARDSADFLDQFVIEMLGAVHDAAGAEAFDATATKLVVLSRRARQSRRCAQTIAQK